MILTVKVKSGLSFACPRCGAFGHRAATGSAAFVAPSGHTVLTPGPAPTIRCHFDRAGRTVPGITPTDWRVTFVDVEPLTQG